MHRNASDKDRPKRKRRKPIVNDPPVRLVMGAMALGVIVGALYAPDGEAFGSGDSAQASAAQAGAASTEDGPATAAPEMAVVLVADDAPMD